MNPKNILPQRLLKHTLGRKQRDSTKSERAIGITVDYIIGLVAVLVLSSVLLAGMTALQDERQDAVTKQEVERIHEKVVGELHAMGVTAQTIERNSGSSDSSVIIDVAIYDNLNDATVSVAIDASSANSITVTSQANDVTVTEDIQLSNTYTAVSQTTGQAVTNKFFTMRYQTSTGEIQISTD